LGVSNEEHSSGITFAHFPAAGNTAMKFRYIHGNLQRSMGVPAPRRMFQNFCVVAPEKAALPEAARLANHQQIITSHNHSHGEI
jgi:hypothetical protein